MNSSLSQERAALRRELKARRRRIPPAQRAAAARQVARNIRRAFPLHPGKRIAVYSPLPYELDSAPLIALARRHGCRIFLPRLTDRRRFRMRFIEATGPMEPNHLGILEPMRLSAMPVHDLDLVFVPLVGFDATGMRLGMGAGYYDRAFAFLKLRRSWRRPLLVGVGFSVQQVPHIAGAAHDVLLDHVVTEKGLITCTTGS